MRNAKTLTPSHMKLCILEESRFDFLRDLVSTIPDVSAQEDQDNNSDNALSTNSNMIPSVNASSNVSSDDDLDTD